MDTTTPRSTLATDPGPTHPGPSEGPALVGERYRDLGLLAEGGMGEVRRVEDRLLSCVVAMKVLAPDRVGSAWARARFVAEATVTARLQHPGIVAVHDRGERADGRLWYTMTEVRGQTLEAEVPKRGGGSGDLRRRIDLLRRVCEAMAYAHAQGVVHRDLKPANIMVGPFGEVLVMDWGIARILGQPDDPSAGDVPATFSGGGTQIGDVLGTPAYMAPEQACGDLDAISPATDVYALGVVLFQLLLGRLPLEGSPAEVIWRLAAGEGPTFDLAGDPPVPEALREVCTRALARRPAERFADAGAVGAALVAWLDGAERTARAEALVAAAREGRPVIAAERERARSLRERAGTVLGALRSFDPVAAKAPAWALESEAAAIEQAVVVQEVRWLQQVGSALELVPELPAAHATLAEHYAETLLDAEARGDVAGAVRAEHLLATHDRGAHRHLLAGSGTVTVVTEPPGAEVHLFRFVEQAHRLVAEPRGTLPRTPLVEAPLERGSWLLELRHAGCEPVRYPVFLGRGESWDGIRPGDTGAAPIQLPPLGSLAPDDCLVPAGWFWSGGDPDALEPLPRRRLWADAFVMKRHPVTNAEYAAFLDALVARGDAALVARCEPRMGRRHGAAEDDLPVWSRGPDGRFVLGVDVRGRLLLPDAPVVLVDAFGTLAYTRWRAEVDEVAWRLPNELEWEKAARGVDGSTTVWGRHFEPTWANVLGSTAETPALAPVHAHPEDVSVFGVHGLSGNARQRCGNRWTHEGPRLSQNVVLEDPASDEDAGFRATRGGAFTSGAPQARPANRFADYPSSRFEMLGFRLCRPLSSPW